MTLPTDRDAREELLTRYVLGDLSAAEARALEADLGYDPALAREVAELRTALDALAYDAVTTPPPDLKARVLAAAEPTTPAVEALATAPASPAPTRRLVSWPRLVGAIAAALLLAVGLDNARLRRELALQRDVMTTLQQPNVLMSFALAGVDGGRGAVGRVVLDLDAKKAAVVIHDLPALPSGEVYRLWARVGEQHVPCGNLTAAADGTVVAQLPIPVDAYTSPVRALVLTRETARDAASPQGAAVMRSS
jgi:hypothetical protein